MWPQIPGSANLFLWSLYLERNWNIRQEWTWVMFPIYSTHFSHPDTRLSFFYSSSATLQKKATRLSQVQSSEKNQRNPWTCRYSKILRKACDAMNVAAYCATLTRVRDHTNPLGMFSLSHRRLTEQEQREREEKTGSREVAEQYIVSVRCPINSSV